MFKLIKKLIKKRPKELKTKSEVKAKNKHE